MTPIKDIVEFVGIVNLETVTLHEERARLLHWTEQEIAEREFPLSASSLAIAVEASRFRYRFRVRHTDEWAEYVADIEAVYAAEEPAEVDEDVSSDFAGRVAFMAVYPFLRASIFNSAARLGQPIPVLGMVRQGEFQTGEAMSPEDTRVEFLDNRSETVPQSS